MRTLPATLSLCLSGLLFACGCGGPADSAPAAAMAPGAAMAAEPIDPVALGLDVSQLPVPEAHAAPETFPEAVAQLEALRDTVRDGFASGDIDKAHGPLHEVGYLLEAIEEMAGGAAFDEDGRARVARAVDQLFDDFGAVDAQFHGDAGKDYADVADSVDAAIRVLRDHVSARP